MNTHSPNCHQLLLGNGLRAVVGLILILTYFFLQGCATQRSAEKYYNKHPDKLMAYAARLAPNIDSVGTPYVAEHTPANNIDYTKQIDSLEQEAQKAKELADNLEQILHTPDPATLAEKAKLQKQVGSLLAQVKQLQARYKPCEPDTAKIVQPIYRELGYKLADLRYQLGEEVRRREIIVEAHQKEMVKKDAKIKKQEADIKRIKKQRNKVLWILFVIAGGAIVWLFIKLRSKIPIVGRP